MSTHTGKKIKSLSRGAIMGNKRGNELIEAVNALLNAKVRQGSKDQVLISDSNSIYEYRGNGNGSGSLGTGQILTLAKITSLSDYADYISVKDWDGTSYTTEEYEVAKTLLARQPLTEDIDGVTLTYTYTDDNNRSSTDGTNTEAQVLYPRYVVGGLIWVGEVNYTNVDIDGDEVLYMEVIPPRFWVRKYLQA